MDNKKEFKPIAMKCNHENFNAIKPILISNNLDAKYNTFHDNYGYSYLVNNLHGLSMRIGTVTEPYKTNNERTVFEEWNQDIFLEYCGISTKKIEESNQLNESPFYMVFVEEGNSPSYKHSTYSSAYDEAKRLAKSTGRKAWVIAPLISVELTKFTEEYYSPNMGS